MLNVAICTLFCLWLIVILLFHINKLKFFEFIIGTIGFFIFSMIFGKRFLSDEITYFTTYTLSLISSLVGGFSVYVEQFSVTIQRLNEVLSFYISYECSGLIEILVYFSILLFYPIFTLMKRIKYAIIGVVYIMVCNIFRILFVIYSIKIFGNKAFFLSHTVIGRIIFMGLMTILYYKVFTKNHIFKRGINNVLQGI